MKPIYRIIGALAQLQDALRSSGMETGAVGIELSQHDFMVLKSLPRLDTQLSMKVSVYDPTEEVTAMGVRFSAEKPTPDMGRRIRHLSDKSDV